MPRLTHDQINSFIEKIGKVFGIPLFTEGDTNRLLTLAQESVEWEGRIKEELYNAGLPASLDQIPVLLKPCNPSTNNSILELQTLNPIFWLYNLEVRKENISALADKISTSKKLLDAITILCNGGLPASLDQIRPLKPCNPSTNNSILELHTLNPIFLLYNLEVRKENISVLVDKISTSKKLADAVSKKLMSLDLPVNSKSIDKLGLFNKDCTIDYTAPFSRDFYSDLDELKALRPEYLIGTWFNREERPFRLDMELDWVNRMAGTKCYLPDTIMGIELFASTGLNISNFITEVHVHRTVRKEFDRPRDGWIEAPGAGADLWKYTLYETSLNFIGRMIEATGSRAVVALNSGTGGWATFEQVGNSDITPAAARLLLKFSGPHYCVRSDGKVVIGLKERTNWNTLTDMSKFPTGRTLVDNKNKFPLCIP